MTTITIDRAVVEQALKALEGAAECVQQNYLPDKCGHDWDEQIIALRAALAQEPTSDFERGFQRGWQRAMRDRDRDALVRAKVEAELAATVERLAELSPIRELHAQQAEPVEPAFHGFMSADGTQVDVCFTPGAPRSDGAYATAYYTAPPQRKPLSEGEIIDAVRDADLDWAKGWTLDEMQGNRFATLARAIERAHGIGEEK